MRGFCISLVLFMPLALTGCESIKSTWNDLKMPDMSSFGFDEKPKQSACKNALCDGLPEKDCLEIPYCQKP